MHHLSVFVHLTNYKCVYVTCNNIKLENCNSSFINHRFHHSSGCVKNKPNLISIWSRATIWRHEPRYRCGSSKMRKEMDHFSTLSFFPYEGPWKHCFGEDDCNSAPFFDVHYDFKCISWLIIKNKNIWA